MSISEKTINLVGSGKQVSQGASESGEFSVEWLLQLIGMIVTDEAFLLYMNDQGVVTAVRKTAKFPFPMKVGDEVTDKKIASTITAKAWHTRQPQKGDGNRELFGISYFASATPVIWQGTFYGVLTVVTPASALGELRDGVNQITDRITALDSLTRELAIAGATFAEGTEHIVSAMDHLHENAKHLKEINALVAEVAAQTNLLGLNAAIEAARAGDQGRGFGVVAGEIRRLSTMVKDSSKQVRKKVEEISEEVSTIQGVVAESAAVTEEQTAQLEELSATVTQIREATEALRALGQ